MSLLALAVFIATPTADAPAQTHEKILHTSFKELSANDLPKSIWTVSNTDGIHAQSNLVCPASVGAFERDKLVPFDNFGLDVGCNFNAQGAAVITMYLTRRANRQLADDFADAKSALEQRLPNAQLVAGAPPAPAGLPFTGSLYTLPDGLRTGIWVADVAGWTFKFRGTYMPEREAETLKAMSALTAKMAETAGKHLNACAAAPPAVRNGVSVPDQKSSGLALLAVIGVAAAEEKGTPVAQAPDQWCAEEPMVDQKVPMLLWRDIARPAGAADGVDRISLMTMEEPPMLISADNPILAEIEKEIPGPIYQLTGAKGDVGFVFAFFSGRPSATTLTPLAKDIFLGKRKPLAAYDLKTNSIIISVDASKPAEGKLKLMIRQGDIPPPFRELAK